MKLNYFILVSKDNEVSHAITKEFVDTHNIENIMEKISQDVASEDFAVFSRVLAHLLQEMNKLRKQSDK